MLFLTSRGVLTPLWTAVIVLFFIIDNKVSTDCNYVIDLSKANIKADVAAGTAHNQKDDNIRDVAGLYTEKPFCFLKKIPFYIQVDFPKAYQIRSLKIKGYFPEYNGKQYYAFTRQISFDGKKWLLYKDKDGSQYCLVTFSNKDNGNIQLCQFDHQIFAKHLRIYPTAPNNLEYKKICLRFEVRGCNEAFLPNLETADTVEGRINQQVKLKCISTGMVGMRVVWKDHSTEMRTNSPSENLIVKVENELTVNPKWSDLQKYSCKNHQYFLNCSKVFTCTGSYNFNNKSAEKVTWLNIKYYFPTKPLNFSVKNKKKNNKVILSWEPPKFNDFNKTMLEYEMSCNNTGTFIKEILPLSTNTRSLSNLEVYTAYQCTLKVQIQNESASTFPYRFEQEPVVLNFRSRTIQPNVKPTLNVRVVSPTVIGIDFDVVFDKPKYGNLKGFVVISNLHSHKAVNNIERSKIPESEKVIKTVISDPTIRSFNITKMKPWSRYQVTLKAENEDGLFSKETSKFIDLPEGVPNKGPEMSVIYTHPDSILVEISFDSSFYNGNVTGYQINRMPGNYSTYHEINKESFYTISNLQPFQSYTLKCKAKTRVGFGKYGKAIVVFTTQDVPSVPQHVQIIPVAETNLILRWTKPLHPNGNITNYTIKLTLKNGTLVEKYAPTNKLDFFRINISKHDVKHVEVCAATVKGLGPCSPRLNPEPNSANPTNESWNNMVIIIAFTVAMIFLFFLVGLCCVHIRSKSTRRSRNRDPIAQPIFPHVPIPDDDEDEMELIPVPRLPQRSDSIGTGSQSFPDNTTQDPIPVEEFANYMSEVKSSNDDKLLEQFHSIPSGKCSPWQVAELPENKVKNRYANIAAYDHSRVVLPCCDGNGKGDYINANSIHGYDYGDNGGVKYISTQGPLDSTQNDFWNMVWQEEVTVIVMLTNLHENDKIKCSQYWPHKQKQIYGNVRVTLDKIDKTADYVTRTFQLEMIATKEVRTVLQFHFVSWPDHGVPEYPTAILSLRRRVRHYYDDTKPMLVHCSAGVGRSGCFILIDAMLERIDNEKSVDVFNYLKYMRTRRTNMVQNFEQYRFTHTAILEYITFGNTEIFIGELDKKIRQLGKNNGMEDEFSLLTRNTVETSGSYYQVLLREGRFIDAYHVDGYKQRDAFILTKACTEKNVADFWKMVLEKQCHTIVMLNKCQETTQEYFKYWPQVDNLCVYHDTTVFTTSEVANGNIITRKIKVTTNKRRCEVHHFQYVDWPDSEVPHRRGYTNICTLMQAVEKSQQNLGNGPIIVHEGNGYGRSGSFVSIYNSTERLKVEQLIDVLQCVRAIRIAQPLAIDNITQYQFVYNMLRTYLEGFENYSNYNDYKATRSPLGSTSA